MSAEEQITRLDLELPPAAEPLGLYKPLIIVGNLAYTSGHGPLMPDGSLTVGRIGSQLDVEAGHAAARQTGLALLATVRKTLGSLDRVKRVVKLFGMVNCEPDFTAQPAVINGCSELFAQVFGDDAGVGARSAVGVTSLPGNWPVEIEAIFEIA